MESMMDTVETTVDQREALDHDVEKLIREVQALLFAAHDPLVPSILHSLNGHTGWTVDAVVDEINRRMDSGGHPMRVRKVAGGYQMHVLPEYGPIIESILVKTKTQRLSRAGLETLAIVAYRQPCSTPEIEHIRGVAADAPIRTLLERNLIAIKGRSEGPGRPLLYGTTQEFLHYFGLNSLDDLPREEELSALLAARAEEKMRNQNDIEGEKTLTLKLPMDSPGSRGLREFRIRDVITTLTGSLDN